MGIHLQNCKTNLLTVIAAFLLGLSPFSSHVMLAAAIGAAFIYWKLSNTEHSNGTVMAHCADLEKMS